MCEAMTESDVKDASELLRQLESLLFGSAVTQETRRVVMALVVAGWGQSVTKNMIDGIAYLASKHIPDCKYSCSVHRYGWWPDQPCEVIIQPDLTA